MTANLNAAVTLAAVLHDGQVDKAGKPYILHPLRVMLAVELAGGSAVQQCAAVLHDTVEDYSDPEQAARSIAHGLGPEVLELVLSLTRQDGESYADFIGRVSRTPAAVLVKVSDIRDNLSRMDSLAPDTAKGLTRRYERALEVLL